MVNTKYKICVSICLIVLILVIIYNYDCYEGVYSIDSDFASQANISSGVLYVGPKHLFRARDCYLYIKKTDDSVVEDQKIELSFGMQLSVKGSNNWPVTLSYKMSNHSKLHIYENDITYFVGFKDNALSYVAKKAHCN